MTRTPPPIIFTAQVLADMPKTQQEARDRYVARIHARLAADAAKKVTP